MERSKIGLVVWLVLVTALWAVQPILITPARGVAILGAMAALLALLGWMSSFYLLVVWSGVTGLLNLTLALLLATHPPSLWVGISAGVTLLALLDGSQRYAYMRHCQVEPGVMSTMLDTFIRLSGLSVGTGLLMGGILVALSPLLIGRSLVSLFTLLGAALFAGFLALFLLYGNRISER